MSTKKQPFERTLIPLVLTVISLAIGGVLGALFGVAELALYMAMLALPLLLLWLTRDVETIDDKLAAMAAAKTVRPAPPVREHREAA